MNIKELRDKLNTLNAGIKEIISQAEYNEYEDLSGLEKYDDIMNSPEQLQMFDECRDVLCKLAEVQGTISYLNRPVTAEGYLQKQNNGRYALYGTELQCGSGIEYLCEDDSTYYDFESGKCRPYWKASRIEHNNANYYIAGCKKDIDSVKVRIRR